MNWIPLEHKHQIDEIQSAAGYSIIFKHSTRCSISMMAKKRFELDWEAIPAGTGLYFLDLIRYREISNAIADRFNVNHESPQLLLIRNGECILDSSHGEISADEAADQIIQHQQN